MHMFKIHSMLGTRSIVVTMDHAHLVTINTTTGFDKRPVQHSINIPKTRTAIDFLMDCKEWEDGARINDVLGYLTSEDREFLISGTTPEEWNKLFPPGDIDNEEE